MALYVDNKIFIHIYKTGGESVRRAMRCLGESQEIGGKHATADDIKNDPRYENAYKFTVVRNPYEWLVSLWSFICFGSSIINKPSGHPLNAIAPKDFPKFVDFWVEYMQPDGKHWHLHQSHFINKDINIFKLEDMHKSRLIFMEGIGKYNVGKHDKYEKYYTNETKEIVSRIMHKDFEMFDYPI